MKKNLKKILIIMYLILLCFVFMKIGFSKNTSKINGEATASIAKMILNVEKTNDNDIYLDNNKKYIQFMVNNFEKTIDGVVSYNEVEYNYKIEILKRNDIPLEYELYRIDDGKEIQMTLNNGVSDEIVMPHSKEKEDKYILKVKMNDKTYKNIEDILSIEVYAIQTQD